ncbi:59_t:CDS:2 [Funneliformis caledonium]|uniref:59_t:CDS:1 n=1 Tax=Funneliformis caledonium TaxID=1117310 RepID=A0A9N9DN66_9GLOM|nr:59_t:CDS:2 [Funneliformis caledonium]
MKYCRIIDNEQQKLTEICRIKEKEPFGRSEIKIAGNFGINENDEVYFSKKSLNRSLQKINNGISQNRDCHIGRKELEALIEIFTKAMEADKFL